MRLWRKTHRETFFNHYVERDVGFAGYDSFPCAHVLELVPDLFVKAPGEILRLVKSGKE